MKHSLGVANSTTAMPSCYKTYDTCSVTATSQEWGKVGPGTDPHNYMHWLSCHKHLIETSLTGSNSAHLEICTAAETWPD